MADLKHFLEAIRAKTGFQPKLSGNGNWVSRCPAHDDRRPSLSIRESNGKILVNCFAGCSYQDIVASLKEYLGIETQKVDPPSDLKTMIGKLSDRFGPISAMWSYENADGKSVAMMLRWDLVGGKQFRPLTYRGGGWVLGAPDAPRPIWNLKEVSKANFVVVVEGEKCAEAVRKLGLAATTSMCGSSAAHLSDWTPLAGKKVAILPDNDEAGRKYAKKVFSILSALDPPADARIIELPGLESGGDVADLGLRSAKELMELLKRGNAIAKKPSKKPKEPPVVPVEMLSMPGFVDEVMDISLSSAPYPNVAAAFCGAVSLLALLAGRKAVDESGLRSNLYLLVLSHSGSGKDWPRKVNVEILRRLEMLESVADRFASGEGIQDALLRSPAMLFQTDEFDGMLKSITKARDARYESILGILMTLHGAAGTIYPLRRRANDDGQRFIEDPHLVIYGSAVPNHYYDSFNDRLLTCGFFARMIAVEAGKRGSGNDSKPIVPTDRVLDTACWWRDYASSGSIVPQTEGARQLFSQRRSEIDLNYASCEARNDAFGTSVWSRALEHARKLAMLRALSRSHMDPLVCEEDVDWAVNFMFTLIRRTMFMATDYYSENDFDHLAQRFLRLLRKAGGTMRHSAAIRSLHINANDMAVLVESLEQRNQIECEQVMTSTRPYMVYRLVEGENET